MIPGIIVSEGEMRANTIYIQETRTKSNRRCFFWWSLNVNHGFDVLPISETLIMILSSASFFDQEEDPNASSQSRKLLILSKFHTGTMSSVHALSITYLKYLLDIATVSCWKGDGVVGGEACELTHHW